MVLWSQVCNWKKIENDILVILANCKKRKMTFRPKFCVNLQPNINRLMLKSKSDNSNLVDTKAHYKIETDIYNILAVDIWLLDSSFV